LPFENLTGDPQQEYLCDGLTDGMIGLLSRLQPERLAVISRTSVAQYKGTKKGAREIARELDADYLLESSVNRVENHVRVDAHLVQASDQTQVWSNSFDREMKDVLTLQGEVAQAIAAEVNLTLSPARASEIAHPRAISAAGFDAYLRGRYLVARGDPEAFKQGIAYLEQAVQLAPDHAEAHAALAQAYAVKQMAADARPRDVAPRAEAEAQLALRLDDGLPEAHRTMAFIALNYGWDWQRSDQQYRRALELDPSLTETELHVRADYFSSLGRHEEAIAATKSALSPAPFSIIDNMILGRDYYFARQYDAAVQQLKRTIELQPHFSVPRLLLALALIEEGRYDEARTEIDKPADDAVDRLGTSGYLEAAIGHRDEAQKIMSELQARAGARFISPYYWLGSIQIRLGDRNAAFEWLEKCYQERDFRLIYLRVDPHFDPLRADPRFSDLIRRIGIPVPR
jgi:TolB-like protein/Tfp pilus assembly protein PilF